MSKGRKRREGELNTMHQEKNAAPTDSLEKNFQRIHSRIDTGRLLRDTHNLWQAELGQTFASFMLRRVWSMKRTFIPGPTFAAR